MTGHDASVSDSCAYPNTLEMRAKYELVAKAELDFIWVDDNIWMHHQRVAFGCLWFSFLALFANRARWTLSSEDPVQAFDSRGKWGYAIFVWIGTSPPLSR